MADFVRGCTVLFAIQFFDVDGNPVTPASVELTIDYPHCGAYESVASPMSLVSGDWVFSWDSEISDHGEVDWSARSSPAPQVTVDGSFVLTANRANVTAEAA